jgi:hypothetical protein
MQCPLQRHENMHYMMPAKDDSFIKAIQLRTLPAQFIAIWTPKNYHKYQVVQSINKINISGYCQIFS